MDAVEFEICIRQPLTKEQVAELIQTSIAK